MARTTEDNVTGWVGWVYFAGFLMLILGIFQAIEGLVALFNNTLIVTGSSHVWLVNLTTWGWTHLIIGLALIATSINLLRGGLWGRSVGVVLVILSAIANFAFIPVYPLWSIVMLTLDGLMLYAIVAHGGEARTVARGEEQAAGAPTRAQPAFGEKIDKR